jgi:drug/metabolite transporter (DMT)-like permease
VRSITIPLFQRDVPLDGAQSFTAARFVAIIVAIIVASAVVLVEPISPLRCAGVLLLAAGIAIVAWSQR